jgi:two-component system cell cycle response regulator CtrA
VNKMDSEIERLRTRVAELEFHISEMVKELQRVAESWPLRLPPTYALVLSVFLKHPKMVLTKEFLWRNIYAARIGHEDEWPDPKIIDVFICKLRPIIKRYDIYIETIWGRGWRIDEVNHTKLVALSNVPFGTSPEAFTQANAAGCAQ